MATYAARAQAIADALLNTTATAAQQLRLGRALAYREGTLAEFDAATNALKAEMFVKASRRLYLSIVRTFEGDDSASTARHSTETQVGIDFSDGT